jgi:hypothetical protein
MGNCLPGRHNVDQPRYMENNAEFVVSNFIKIIKYNTISKSKMISRRQGEGDEAYCIYIEEADDAANKDSALI